MFSFDEPGGLGLGRSVPMENVGAGKAPKPFISQFPLLEQSWMNQNLQSVSAAADSRLWVQ